MNTSPIRLRAAALVAAVTLSATATTACGVADHGPVQGAATASEAPTATPAAPSVATKTQTPVAPSKSGKATVSTKTASKPSSTPSSAPSAIAARAAVTYLVECVEDQLVQRPDEFTLACADSNQYLDQLQWADWGADTARATGVVKVKECVPSCAASNKYLSYPVRVTASTLVEGEASATYRKLTVTATGSRPKGAPAVETFDLLGHQPGSGPESMVP